MPAIIITTTAMICTALIAGRYLMVTLMNVTLIVLVYLRTKLMLITKLFVTEMNVWIIVGVYLWTT